MSVIAVHNAVNDGVDQVSYVEGVCFYQPGCCMYTCTHKTHANAATPPPQVLAGGVLPSHPGQFYPPTLLVDVTPAMNIWREEVFGPVFTIVRCRDDDHAVELANDCPFGLSSSVFSRSKARAKAIGARLEVSDT